MTMAESDLSSLPDIDSGPEIIGSETVTDGKSSTQLTLLDRLKILLYLIWQENQN